MLEIDRETTLSKVLPNFKDITVEEAIKLNELGLDIKPKINFNSKISQGYAYNVSSNYDAGCSSEYDYLLDELYSLFAKDSKSSPALVEALIKSYRYLLSTENNFAVREVEQLIAIKKKFPEKFIYVFGQKPAFDCVTGNVILASLDIATINHETSHALHFYLTNNYFPEKYNEVATSVASNPKFKEKIANFAKEYDLVNNKISDIISSSGVEDYYSGTKLEELSQRLSAKKEEQKEKYRNRYPENVLDTLFERTYTVQEFISQRKKIEEAELEDKIMRAHFTGLMPISDIIDAISGGRLTSEGMRNSEGKLIDLSGHGMRYYDEPRARFKEIVAQYGTILKSKDANNSLHLLREVVGDELVDFVAGFYERMLKNTEFNLGTQSDKKVI